MKTARNPRKYRCCFWLGVGHLLSREKQEVLDHMERTSLLYSEDEVVVGANRSSSKTSSVQEPCCKVQVENQAKEGEAATESERGGVGGEQEERRNLEKNNKISMISEDNKKSPKDHCEKEIENNKNSEDNEITVSSLSSLSSVIVSNKGESPMAKKMWRGNPLLRGCFKAAIAIETDKMMTTGKGESAEEAPTEEIRNLENFLQYLVTINFLVTVEEGMEYVNVLMCIDSMAVSEIKLSPKSKIRKTTNFPILFKNRGKKAKSEKDENSTVSSLVSPMHRMLRTVSSPDDLIMAREKYGFCFGFSQTLAESDEEIQTEEEPPISTVPPGLVGLQNLGNTCFLNAALQCLRCTPGLAEMVLPELKDRLANISTNEYHEFEEIDKENKKEEEDKKEYEEVKAKTIITFLKRPSLLLDKSDDHIILVTRQKSLPVRLPHEIGGIFTKGSGLTGGSIARMASLPVLIRPPSAFASYNFKDFMPALKKPEKTATGQNSVEIETREEVNDGNLDVGILRKNGSYKLERPNLLDLNIPVVEDKKNQLSPDTCNKKTNAKFLIKENVKIHELQSSATDSKGTKRRRGMVLNPESENLSGIQIPPLPVSQKISDDQGKCENPQVALIKNKSDNSLNETVKDTSPDSDNKKKELAVIDTSDQQCNSNGKEKKEDVTLDIFMDTFKKFIKEVCLGKAFSYINPRIMLDSLKQLPQGELFCDGGQHDCQEVIKVLLDSIHENCNKSPFQNSCIDKDSEKNINGTSDSFNGKNSVNIDESQPSSLSSPEEMETADQMWQRCLKNDCSPVAELFVGQLQIIRICQKCHSHNTTYEIFWDLSLPLIKERSGWLTGARIPNNLDDLLRAFTSAEILQGEDAPFCEACQQKASATRRITIHRFPKVFVLNIKRFKYTKNGREKLTNRVSFPIKELHVENYSSRESGKQGSSVIYDLYAVSNHYGTLGGGHYTAYCKVRDQFGKAGWYCFNDKLVTQVTQETVISPNAYILFYSKRS